MSASSVAGLGRPFNWLGRCITLDFQHDAPDLDRPSNRRDSMRIGILAAVAALALTACSQNTEESAEATTDAAASTAAAAGDTAASAASDAAVNTDAVADAAAANTAAAADTAAANAAAAGEAADAAVTTPAEKH